MQMNEIFKLFLEIINTLNTITKTALQIKAST